MASSRSADEEMIVYHVGPFDVLMGRGSPTTDNEGNTRLRQMVVERHEQYSKAKRQKDKHQVALQIVQDIEARGGRFLRRMSDKKRAPGSKSVSGTSREGYAVVRNQREILEKVKQLMRDMGPEAMERRAERRRYRYRKLGSKTGNSTASETGETAEQKSAVEQEDKSHKSNRPQSPGSTSAHKSAEKRNEASIAAWVAPVPAALPIGHLGFSTGRGGMIERAISNQALSGIPTGLSATADPWAELPFLRAREERVRNQIAQYLQTAGIGNVGLDSRRAALPWSAQLGHDPFLRQNLPSTGFTAPARPISHPAFGLAGLGRESSPLEAYQLPNALLTAQSPVINRNNIPFVADASLLHNILPSHLRLANPYGLQHFQPQSQAHANVAGGIMRGLIDDEAAKRLNDDEKDST